MEPKHEHYVSRRHTRVLHDVPRLREVLFLIRRLAEEQQRPGALAEIARLARCALVVSAPPDADTADDEGEIVSSAKAGSFMARGALA
jgi:hypothetical protein